jgi:hypothetical protein
VLPRWLVREDMSTQQGGGSSFSFQLPNTVHRKTDTSPYIERTDMNTNMQGHPRNWRVKNV